MHESPTAGPVGRSLIINGYHPPMATWIIVGSCVVAALILGGAVLVVLLFTRGKNDDDVHLPRFKRFDSSEADETTTPPEGD